MLEVGQVAGCIRVAVVDDHPTAREGVTRIIESAADLRVVLSASTGSELLDAMRAGDCGIDVCLLDLSLPDIDGIDLIPQVIAKSPTTKVLAFTMHAETAFGVGCIKSGASGFLTKGAAPSELRDAIRSVHRGERALTPELRALLSDSDHPRAPAHTTLSPREWAVFIRLAQGLRNADISRELEIDQRTVSSYRRRVLDKLDLNSDADLARYAVLHRLVDPLPPVNSALRAVRAATTGGLTPDMVNMWERLAEGLPLSVIVTDIEGTVTHWSTHATTLFGYDRSEALGTPIMALTVGPDNSDIATDIMSQLTKGEMWDGEFRARRKDGTPVDLHVFDIPVLDASGNLVGICGLSIDVSTQRGELRDALNRHQDLFDRLQRIKEAERSRIAADIHDDIGQHLTSLRTQLLGLKEERLADPAEFAATLESAVSSVDSVLAEVRRICAQLRPPLLERLGLAETLRSLCTQTAARTGLRISVDVDRYQAVLDTDAELEVFRIAQEALTNIERHASARHVSVYLADECDEEHRIVLEIDDDGRGFSTDDGMSRDTTGLHLMHERARRLRGRLNVTSLANPSGPHGSGTVVRLEIPCSAQSALQP